MGGENLFGGAANGTPRNWFTVAVANAIEVVVPITIPEARVACGGRSEALTIEMANNATTTLYKIAIDVCGVKI